MVRLKAFMEMYQLLKRMFQFHYGTIKSIYDETARMFSYAFQFHYGTIKRYPRARARGPISVSIPLWYD